MTKILITFAVLSAISAHIINAQPAQTAQDYYRAAQSENQKGNFSGAVELYTNCLKVEPQAFGCQSARGSSYLMLGDKEHARLDFETAVANGRKFGGEPVVLGEAYNNRGTFYAIEKEYLKAIADFSAAVKISPAAGPYYKNRARAYCLSGQSKLAAADEEKAADLGESVDEYCEQEEETFENPGFGYYFEDRSGFRLMTITSENGKFNARSKENFAYRIAAAAIDPFGKTIAYAFDRQTKIFIRDFGLQSAGSQIKFAAEIGSLEYSPDGRYLAVGLINGDIKLVAAADGRQVKNFRLSEATKARTFIPIMKNLNFDDTGRFLAGHDGNSFYGVWNVETGKLVAEGYKMLEHGDESQFLYRYLKNYDRKSEMPGWVIDWSKSNHDSFFRAGMKFIRMENNYEGILFNNTNEKELAMLIFPDENSWFVITPGGFFDGSQSAIAKFHVMKNSKSYPAKNYNVRFYQPNLLRQITGHR